MKEATGELNMTVITVVAIAAIAAIFYAFVWPGIKKSIYANQVCTNAPGTVIGTKGSEGYVSCSNVTAATGKYTCSYFSGGKSGSATCQPKQ